MERIPLRYLAVTSPSAKPSNAPTMLITTPSATICSTTCVRETPIARMTAISPARSFTDTVTSVVTSRNPTSRLTLPRMIASWRK